MLSALFPVNVSVLTGVKPFEPEPPEVFASYASSKPSLSMSVIPVPVPDGGV